MKKLEISCRFDGEPYGSAAKLLAWLRESTLTIGNKEYLLENPKGEWHPRNYDWSPRALEILNRLEAAIDRARSEWERRAEQVPAIEIVLIPASEGSDA